MSVEGETKTGVMEKLRLRVSPAPHVHGHRETSKVMFIVMLALLFPTAGGIYYFGLYALFVVLTSVVTAVLTEYVAKMLRKREFVMDYSAVVTGLLFALVLPPRIPLWAVVIGSAFSIAIVKEAFGGLGHNIFNPALAGRAFMAVTFAGLMTGWVAPVGGFTADAVTAATPLSEGFAYAGTNSELLKDLFFGNVGGCIGETSALLILIGGMILFIPGVIKRVIPIVYIGTVFLFAMLLGEDPLFHILAGGLFLGAFFMATDYVTAPLTTKGQAIFAFGAGVLVVMIRLYGSMPEGVAFSILLMNAFTPLIDRYVRPKPYGYVPPPKEDKEEEKKEPKKDDEKKPDKTEEKKSEPKEEKPAEKPASAPEAKTEGGKTE